MSSTGSLLGSGSGHVNVMKLNFELLVSVTRIYDYLAVIIASDVKIRTN